MKYFRDLVIGGLLGVRFKRYWYMNKWYYTLMLTEEEFDHFQALLDEVVVKDGH